MIKKNHGNFEVDPKKPAALVIHSHPRENLGYTPDVRDSRKKWQQHALMAIPASLTHIIKSCQGCVVNGNVSFDGGLNRGRPNIEVDSGGDNYRPTKQGGGRLIKHDLHEYL